MPLHRHYTTQGPALQALFLPNCARRMVYFRRKALSPMLDTYPENANRKRRNPRCRISISSIPLPMGTRGAMPSGSPRSSAAPRGPARADPAQAAASSALLLGGGLYARGPERHRLFAQKPRPASGKADLSLYLRPGRPRGPAERRAPSGRAWSAPPGGDAAGALRSSPSAGGSTMRASPSCTAR